MATEQEKNFLKGFAVFTVIALAFALLPPLGESEDKATKEKEVEQELSQAPAEKVSVEIAESVPAKELEAPIQADKNSPPEPLTAEDLASIESPNAATLMLHPQVELPMDYFQDNSGTAPIPKVLDRYLDTVKNGARFMGRLEDIALQTPEILTFRDKQLSDNPSLHIEGGEDVKVITYNMKIDKPYAQASFDAELLEGVGDDVLIDWINSETGQRIDLFFTSLKPRGGEVDFTLTMKDDSKPPSSRIFVYAATSEMPLLSAGAYAAK